MRKRKYAVLENKVVKLTNKGDTRTPALLKNMVTSPDTHGASHALLASTRFVGKLRNPKKQTPIAVLGMLAAAFRSVSTIYLRWQGGQTGSV